MKQRYFCLYAFINNKKGQALVEMALILPLVFLIIFGFIEIGLSIAEKQKLLHATNHAAVVGALTNNDLKVSGTLQNFYPDGNTFFQIETTQGSTSTVTTSANRRYGDTITVTTQRPLTLNVPFLNINTIDLHVQSSAKVTCIEKTAPYTCD